MRLCSPASGMLRRMAASLAGALPAFCCRCPRTCLPNPSLPLAAAGALALACPPASLPAQTMPPGVEGRQCHCGWHQSRR